MKLKNKDILNFVNGCASLREKRLTVKLAMRSRRTWQQSVMQPMPMMQSVRNCLRNTQQKAKMESSWLRTGSIPSRTKRALQKTWMSFWRLRQRLASILFLRKRLRNVTIHVMMP